MILFFFQQAWREPRPPKAEQYMISHGHVDAGQCDPAHWYKCRSAKAGAISIGQISTFSRGWMGMVRHMVLIGAVITTQ